jgi:hypothetical protein
MFHQRKPRAALRRNRPVSQPFRPRVVQLEDRISPAVINVATTDNINTVIASASAGDTLQFAPGVYQQQFTVNKNLTLVGASVGATVIQSPSSLTPDPLNEEAIVEIDNSATVAMSGFIVTGPIPSAPPDNSYGIFVSGGATLNLSNSLIQDIRDEPLDGAQHGIGIGVGKASVSTVGHATISNVTVTDYQKGGIVISGAGSTATLTNNTVIGIGDTPLIAQNGIQVSSGALASLSGDTVSGNEYSGGGSGSDPLNDVQSTGILLFSAAVGTTVSNETLSGNDIGIYNLSDGATLNGNELTNNRYENIALDQGAATVMGNTITGGNIGVLVVSFTGNTADSVGTVTSNTITGTVTGISLLNQSGNTFDPQLVAHFNRIVGNGTGAANPTSGSADATDNWWGSNAGPGGAGSDTVSGTVTFNPWLVLGLSANPSSVNVGQTATLTADLTKNSAGQDTSALGTVPNGIATTFAASLGSVMPASTVTANGKATTTFSAGTVVGDANLSATVDNQTVFL